VFAIYDPRARAPQPTGRPDMSVLQIAPAILATLGVPVPDYMQGTSELAETSA